MTEPNADRDTFQADRDAYLSRLTHLAEQTSQEESLRSTSTDEDGLTISDFQNFSNQPFSNFNNQPFSNFSNRPY
jgi:hypothetical protein